MLIKKKVFRMVIVGCCVYNSGKKKVNLKKLVTQNVQRLKHCENLWTHCSFLTHCCEAN